jgi:hypothetical protein
MGVDRAAPKIKGTIPNRDKSETDCKRAKTMARPDLRIFPERGCLSRSPKTSRGASIVFKVDLPGMHCG